jgi:hypothetical protein
MCHDITLHLENKETINVLTKQIREEAEIRRIMVQGQPGEIVYKTPSPK